MAIGGEWRLLPLGSLILGVDNIDDNRQLSRQGGSVYVTRHRIDTYAQAKQLCRSTSSVVFVPCVTDASDVPLACIWHVIRSELMLFSLHVVTLFFGIVKESLNLRHLDEEDEYLHFIHTVIETVATLLIIMLRMCNARVGYAKVRVSVQRLQRFDPIDDAHLRAVWTWMWLLVASGALCFSVCIVCYCIFDAMSHLGWTLLSNQSCILVMRVLSSVYDQRVEAAVIRIELDQHKVVIYEAMLYLATICAKKSSSIVSDDNQLHNVHQFVDALGRTNFFAKPDYIELDDRLKVPAPNY